MDISVIRDVTDPHILQPDANSVLDLINLSEYRNAAVNFRYREISDRVLVPTVTLHLADESVTRRQNRKNEALYREKVILNLYTGIRKTLNKADTSRSISFKDHSECYKAIASEISLLAGSTSNNRILLVFSNLFENSTLLNIYSQDNSDLLIQDPAKIADLFEKAQLLPENLKGIRVFFVFQPVTREEDFLFLKMAEVYKKLLEARGALVQVQASNNYLN
jgi:hypothetical protein